jgi:ATP-binding cassette subfamily B protein
MIRLLVFHLRPYRAQILFVMVLLLAQAITTLYLPVLNADIIDNGIAKGDTAYILQTGAIMLAVTLVLVVVSIISVYWGSKISMAFGRDVRHAIFRRVQRFSLAELNLFGAPSLITRNTNDVQQVQMVVLMALNVMIAAPVMAIGGVIMAVRQDAQLTGLLVIIIPLMVFVIGIFIFQLMPAFKVMQKRIDRVNQVMREKLSGIRVIRAFVRVQFEEERFAEANEDLYEISLRVARLFALAMPLVMGIFNLSLVAAMWFGSLRVASGAMPIGNLTAFLAYIMQILFSVMMATVMFVMVPRAAASADRINEVLEVDPQITDPPEPIVPEGRRGHVEFRDVEFRYPGAEDPVLCSLSFKAEPGQMTAIVGSTGSGKSTLINLIPRFYDVTAGRVLLDGVDLREMDQEELWSRVGFVPQKAFLFTGTVGSNVRYGKEDATDDEVWRALKTAQAEEFVADMAEGLESPITQGGSNVSGGQRQRLAIARALVKRPEVYVFDDSFSALDYTTDSRLRSALRREVADATVIIVAQRVSTIMRADNIIVLDKGVVVGSGAHDELLSTCATYREIVESQLSEEEIAS